MSSRGGKCAMNGNVRKIELPGTRRAAMAATWLLILGIVLGPAAARSAWAGSSERQGTPREHAAQVAILK